MKVTEKLEAQHAERLNRQRLLLRIVDTATGGLRQNEDPNYAMNYLAKFVEKHVTMLMGKSVMFSVPDLPETREDETKIHEFVLNRLNEVWRYNNKDALLIQLAVYGSVMGDSAARVSYDPEEEQIRIDAVSPLHFYPVFGGADGFDARKMSECWVVMPNPREAKDQRNISEHYVERWTANTWEIWGDTAPKSVRQNALKEIPVVHFPNALSMNDIYGQSDIEFGYDAQIRHNAKATDIGDIIDYNAAPTTIIKGARIAQLERGPNRVWSIPAEADAFNLEMQSDLSASTGFLEHLRLVMHELCNVPLGALGGMEPSDSAVAMMFLFQPLIERRSYKKVQYDAALRRLNRLILKMLEIVDDEFNEKFQKLPKRSRYLIDNYFPDPLPRDETIELDKSKKRIEMGMSTPTHELIRRFGESRKEAERIVAESRQHREEEMKLAQKYGASTGPGKGNPDPTRPSPITQGESRSQTVEKRAAQGPKEEE